MVDHADDVVEAPLIRDPSVERAAPDEIQALLRSLRQAMSEGDRPVTDPLTMIRGQLRPDGALDLCKQGLGPEGARQVLEAIADSPKVRHILFGTNALGAKGMKAVAETVQGDHHLETLYFGCNGVDGQGVAPLAQALATDTTVRSLWLKRNPLGETGVARVAEMLRVNTTITTLDVVCTSLTLNSIHLLTAALGSNPDTALNRLYLGGNQLDADASAAILELVEVTRSLDYLSVASNPLGDGGTRGLLSGITRLGRPIGLGLSNCGLTQDSADVLGDSAALATSLNIGRSNDWTGSGARVNEVGDPGAVALAAQIRSGTTQLRAIGLSGTGVTSRGAAELADAVETSPHQIHTLTVGKGTASTLRRRIRAALKPAPQGERPNLGAIRSRYR